MDGIIRDEHVGEGPYEESERVIQRLLGIDREFVAVDGLGLEAAADWAHLRTPETHLGYGAPRLSSSRSVPRTTRVMPTSSMENQSRSHFVSCWTAGHQAFLTRLVFVVNTRHTARAHLVCQHSPTAGERNPVPQPIQTRLGCLACDAHGVTPPSASAPLPAVRRRIPPSVRPAAHQPGP